MGIWLLDGLDEVLERDPGFFDNLEDLMTTPESVTTPSIVICVRDSLFTTHSGLRDFCEEYAPNVTVYRLEGWQQQSKSDFANIKLKSVEAAQDFGEMHRFHSAYVGARFVDAAAELDGFTSESRDANGQATPACAAARQLRQIFGKFVEETGRGRRKHLDKRAVLRGRHIVAYRQDILDEAIRAGYLRDIARERIRRAKDDQYSEMVKFRTDLQMSSGIRALLNETCKEPGCSHVQ